MAAGSTYTPISTTTLGSAQASLTLNSFSGYTDLVLVCNFGTTKGSQDGLLFRINADSGSNYSVQRANGNGSSAYGDYVNFTNSIVAGGVDGSSTTSITIYNILNYANTSTQKTVLMRNNYSAAVVNASVGLWRSTSAVTSIVLSPESGTNLRTGSTFTLYGILAA